jgi:hypothetical protein
MLSIWTVLWGDAPLWASIPITIALVGLVLWGLDWAQKQNDLDRH